MNEDQASRYHRRKRQVAVASLAWSALLLGFLPSPAATGAGAVMRDVAEAAAVRVSPSALAPTVTVFTYVLLLSIVNEIGGAPLAFYSGYVLERRYDLSSESFAGWVRDQVKAFAVG